MDAPPTPASLPKSDMSAEELEMLADMQRVNEQATRMIADHLDRYIRRNGSEATFEGWIGILHPENVTLDTRLTLADSDHLRLWKEREGARAAAADPDGASFWKGIAGLARGVSKIAAVRARTATHDDDGAATAETEVTSASISRPTAPQVWSPLVSGPDATNDQWGTASDVKTLEAAREEICRLRRLLAQAPTAGAGEHGAVAVRAEKAPRAPTRLDALLRLTRSQQPVDRTMAAMRDDDNDGDDDEAIGSSHARAQAARSSISPSDMASVEDTFGDLLARTEARSGTDQRSWSVSAVDNLFAQPPLHAASTVSSTPPTNPDSGARCSSHPRPLPQTSTLEDLFARPPAAPQSAPNPFG